MACWASSHSTRAGPPNNPALFIITVLVAYAYVWRRGGLDWD